MGRVWGVRGFNSVTSKVCVCTCVCVCVCPASLLSYTTAVSRNHGTLESSHRYATDAAARVPWSGRCHVRFEEDGQQRWRGSPCAVSSWHTDQVRCNHPWLPNRIQIRRSR